MTDDTFVARGISRVWQKGSQEGQEIYLANGTDIVAGYAVTQEAETAATKDIDLCAAGEEFHGIVLQPVNLSYGGRPVTLDEANQDNESIIIQRPGYHNTCYAWLVSSAGTMKAGTKLMVSGTAGQLIKAAVDASSNGAPTDAELSTMLNTVVATLEEDYTSEANAILRKVSF